MSLDWGAPAANAGFGGGGSNLNWGGSASAGRKGGGAWWNPVHAISTAYHAINPIGGLENLASGIAKTFVHPVYGSALGVGQVLQGGAEEAIGHPDAGWAKLQQAAGTFTDVAQKGIVGSLAGWGQGFANLGSDIATPIGLGGQYNKIGAAPFHAIAKLGGESGLGDETYHQLADFTPSTAQARGRKEGFLGAYAGDALLGAGAADVVGGVAGKIGDFQSAGTAGAEAAASAPTADTGAIADATAAEAAAGPGSTAFKVRDISKNVADALNFLPRGAKAATSAGGFLGLKTGDLIAAMHEQAFPGDVPQPEATPEATATPEDVATARATLHPVDAAAEAMTANAEDDVTQRQAERGTSADSKVKTPTGTAPTPYGEVPVEGDAAAAMDETVQNARQQFGPTFVEDRLGQRLSMPAPAWATRIAESLPDSVNRTLAHLNTPMTYFRMRALANDMGHYIEIAQNHERSSPMHTAAEDAIVNLIDTGTKIDQTLTRDQLTHMVGEEVSGRLDGAALLADFARSEGKLAPPDVIEKMVTAAKRNYVGIPDELWNAMDDQTHQAVDKALGDVVEQYKIGSRQRLETMLASRYGARGLERALMSDDELPMTSDQTRLYRRSMEDFRRSAKLSERSVTERARQEADTVRAVLFADKAGQEAIDAQAKIGVNEATITSLHDPIPPGLTDPEGTAQKVLEATIRDGGASFDVGRGVPRTAEGFVVGLHQQFEMPLEQFTRDGASSLIGAIRTPVGFDGTMYDPAALWSGPDATIGTWVHTGPDGTPVVTVNIGVASNGGAPLTALQARILGEGYNQPSVYNPVTGEDVTLSNDPQTQNLNALYVKDALDPKSQFSRVVREMDRTVADGNLRITPDESYAALQNLMQMDRSLSEMDAQYTKGDIFSKWKVQAGTRAPTGEYLTQVGDRMPGESNTVAEPVASVDELAAALSAKYGTTPIDPSDVPTLTNAVRDTAVRLGIDPVAALQLLNQRSDGYIGQADWGRLLAHHDIAQGDINAIAGAVADGATVDPASFQPFRDYWNEEGRVSGDYLKQEGRWQRQLAAGNFDTVREAMTKYVVRQQDSVMSAVRLPPDADVLRGSTEALMQKMADDVKGITLTHPDDTGRFLTHLYKNADLSTLLHEQAHLLRQILPDDVMARVRETYPNIGERADGALTTAGRSAEEQFVTDLQRYVQDKVRGGDVSPIHAALFTRVASILEDGYPAFLASPEGAAVPNDVAAFWDRMFNPDISNPDATHDPLSAQYVRPGPGVNVKQFPWESDAQYAQRSRQYGEARGAQPAIERAAAQAQARARSADATVEKMHEAMLDATPTGKAAEALRARAMKTLGRISDQMDNPTRAQLPPQWRNFMQALDGLREVAKSDTTGGTAEILAEVPETFSAALQFAAERGFEPEYIPDMTWNMARKYMMNHLRIDGEATPDSMRQENTGRLSRADMADRSMEALGAGFVKATRELYRGRLVDFVEQYYAKPLPSGTPIPDGWTTWSPEKTAIITGRSVVPGVGEVALGDQIIVPKEVSSALKSMRADYSQWGFRMLMKSTAPWKTLILTLSPSWYLKHFMGAVMLASAEGVKLQDWKTAWGQFKDHDLPEVSRGRSVYSTLEDSTDKSGATTGSTFQRPTFGEGGTLDAEGARIALKEVNNRMRGIVKNVDALGRASVFAKTLREGGSYEYAITRSYEALGDFGNLSPFERDAVQAVIPFYAFQKAMLRVLLHVSSDHPIATGTLMQLGRMHNAYLGQQLGGLPANLIGAGITGGTGHKQLVQYAKLNPLTDSYQLLTPDGLAHSLNPIAQLIAAQVFHYSTFNDNASMGSYGQLQPQQDFIKNLADTYTSSPVGSIFTGTGKGFNIFNPAKVYTPAQLAALRKRIAKTITAENLVNQQGGYLATDANPPTGASTGPNFGG